MPPLRDDRDRSRTGYDVVYPETAIAGAIATDAGQAYAESTRSTAAATPPSGLARTA